MILDNAPIYDIECLPNVFTLDMELLHSDARCTWEISEFRDDRRELLQWFDWLNRTQTPMIAFNSIHYDYPMLHFLWQNSRASNTELYQKSKSIITSENRFAHRVWENERFAPQIDLFGIHHFGNKAKTTSLKALQINMRLDNVVDSPLGFDNPLTHNEIGGLLIPYNQWDVKSTKAFAHYSMQAIQFRLSLVPQFGPDVMNWDDSKIGSKILEQRLGDELCYDRSSGRRELRQTPRNRIALADIIFPFIGFRNPDFARVLEYLRNQVLTPADVEPEQEYKVQKVQTKGVFAGLKANVGGVEFKFGTGGLHGSVERQTIVATPHIFIRDIDVKGLYPDIAIKHKLAPEHLGHRYVEEYAKLPEERAIWQEKKGKKCVEANSLKLAGNGTYGNSNSPFSIFYDPKYTITITVNGQLMLAMLVEWLLTVPTIQIIQANTDGITYLIHRDYVDHAKHVESEWQKLTKLTLEDAYYTRMFIRDVNSYIAESWNAKEEKYEYKLKGAYWTPDPLNYAASISEAQPPAWHKDLGNCVSIRAAVAAMVHNVPPETFIAMSRDPYDFMLRIKVARADQLIWNRVPIQKTTRYYVAKQGAAMVKVSPPPTGCQIGDYRRANKLTDAFFNNVKAELAAQGRPNDWDARIHTKNQSRYELRETSIEAGYQVVPCNNVLDFDWNNVNYQYYIDEARKLIIGGA